MTGPSVPALGRPATAMGRWSFVACAALIAAAGVVLRFHRIGEAGLWRDEATAAFWSQLAAGDLLRALRDDVHAPLFYLLLGAWSKLAGTSEAALRALPALLGGLAAGAMAWALRPLAGPAALAAAAVLAVMPGFVLISQQVSPYSLLMLITVGALGAQLRLLPVGAPVEGGPATAPRLGVREPNRPSGVMRLRIGPAVLLCLCLAGLVYTHLWSVLLWTALALCVGIVGAISYWRDKRIHDAFWWSLSAHAAAVVLWLPWLVSAVDQAASRTMDHLPPKSAVIDMLRRSSLCWFSHPTTSIAVLLLSGVAGATALILGRRNVRLGAAAMVLLGAGLIPHLVCSLTPPSRVLYYDRYALVCAPAAVGVIFVVLSGALPRMVALWASWGLAAAVGAIPVLAGGGFGMFFVQSYRPSPMREVASLLDREARPQDVIVLYPELYAPALNWYFHGPQAQICFPATKRVEIVNYRTFADRIEDPNAGAAALQAVRAAMRPESRLWLIYNPGRDSYRGQQSRIRYGSAFDDFAAALGRTFPGVMQEAARFTPPPDDRRQAFEPVRVVMVTPASAD